MKRRHETADDPHRVRKHEEREPVRRNRRADPSRYDDDSEIECGGEKSQQSAVEPHIAPSIPQHSEGHEVAEHQRPDWHGHQEQGLVYRTDWNEDGEKYEFEQKRTADDSSPVDCHRALSTQF